MKKIRQLSICKQVTIISFLTTLFIFLITSFCFFIDLKEVPLGILLGGFGSSLSFSLFTIKENIDNHQFLMKLSILFVIIMSLIHASTIIIAACLYYLAGLHIFNVFATFGSSFIGTLCFAVLTLTENVNKKRGGYNQ